VEGVEKANRMGLFAKFIPRNNRKKSGQSIFQETIQQVYICSITKVLTLPHKMFATSTYIISIGDT